MDGKPNILLVVVDAQYDLVMADGRLAVPNAERIVVPATRLLANLDSTEIARVLFTRDTYMPGRHTNGPEIERVASSHCVLGTPGSELVLNPSLVTDDIPISILDKGFISGTWDMWEEPEHEIRLHSYTRQGEDGYGWGTERDFFFHGHEGRNDGPDLTARGYEVETVDTVRILGVASDRAVRLAVDGFLKRGFKVEVMGDLTAGIERDIERVVVDEWPGRVQVI